jgi:preprotein translocase subunit YajC
MMKTYWKTMGAISFILVLVVLFWSFGFSQPQKESMQQKGMMGDI